MHDRRKVKISIIMPVYNEEAFLEKCIRSVQKQTLREWEILCTDDGSTDQSCCILEKLKQEDSRIHVLKQVNQGAGPARNLALKHSSGEFICFLDADDCFLDPKALETLYDSAVRRNVSICGGQFYVDLCGERKYVNIYGDLYRGDEKEKLVSYSDYQYDFHYQNYIYERRLLTDNQIQFPHYRRFQDPPFFVRAMSLAEKFCIVDIPFYCYHFGYKKLNYNEKRMTDLMQGLIDQFIFSGQAGLKRLHRLTYYRLIQFCDRDLQTFVREKNKRFLKKLEEMDECIRREWLEEGCRIPKCKISTLICMQPDNSKDLAQIGDGHLEKWKLPVSDLENGSRIVLYGAGDVGKSYYRQLQNNGDFFLCAWADQNYDKIDTGYPLISPEELPKTSFDIVIISIVEIIPAMQIMDKLLSLGISAEKIVWNFGR